VRRARVRRGISCRAPHGSNRAPRTTAGSARHGETMSRLRCESLRHWTISRRGMEIVSRSSMSQTRRRSYRSSTRQRSSGQSQFGTHRNWSRKGGQAGSRCLKRSGGFIYKGSDVSATSRAWAVPPPAPMVFCRSEISIRKLRQRRAVAIWRAIGWRLAMVVCLFHFSVCHGVAASPKDWSDCKSEDLDTIIPACRRILEDAGTSDADRIRRAHACRRAPVARRGA
jgi:hypothetical protein